MDIQFFIDRLINDTREGVEKAQIEQEKNLCELRSDIHLPNIEFLKKHKLLEEVKKLESGLVREKELNQFAENRKSIIQEYLDKGAIKLIPEKVKVVAKVVFDITENESAKTPSERYQKVEGKLVKIERPSKTSQGNDPLKKLEIKPIKVSDKILMNTKNDFVSTFEIEFQTVIQ